MKGRSVGSFCATSSAIFVGESARLEHLPFRQYTPNPRDTTRGKSTQSKGSWKAADKKHLALKDPLVAFNCSQSSRDYFFHTPIPTRTTACHLTLISPRHPPDASPTLLLIAFRPPSREHLSAVEVDDSSQ